MEEGERRDSPRVRVSESKGKTVSCCPLNGRWARSSLSFDSATASTGQWAVATSILQLNNTRASEQVGEG